MHRVRINTHVLSYTTECTLLLSRDKTVHRKDLQPVNGNTYLSVMMVPYSCNYPSVLDTDYLQPSAITNNTVTNILAHLHTNMNLKYQCILQNFSLWRLYQLIPIKCECLFFYNFRKLLNFSFLSKGKGKTIIST